MSEKIYRIGFINVKKKWNKARIKISKIKKFLSDNIEKMSIEDLIKAGIIGDLETIIND